MRTRGGGGGVSELCSGRVGFLCKRWTKKLFPLPFAFPSFLSLSLWLFAGCSPLLNMAVSLPVTSDPSFSAQTPSLCPVQARPPSLSSVPDSATHPSRSPFLLWLCFSLFFFSPLQCRLTFASRCADLRRPAATGTENGPDLCSTKSGCCWARRA